MSQENVEIVRAAWDAWNRGDWDEWRSYLSPDFELDGSSALGEWRGVTRGPLSQHRLRHRPRKYLARADVSVGQRQQILRARYLDRLLDRRGSAQQAEPASVSKRLLSHQEQHPQPR